MTDDRFLKAVSKTLEHEGDYVNYPDDLGGETRFGISKRSYPELDIRNLTLDQATGIYFRDFWQKNRCGDIKDAKLAEKVFDLSVNLGPYRANVLLQVAINFAGRVLCVDGIIGPKTLEAVNSHPKPDRILDKLILGAVRYYLSLQNTRFERGWLIRAVA